MYKHLFGPVPSRRLGMSLGVDLVPHKVCSLNCVYCECGRTTMLTTERKEYVLFDKVVLELKDYFQRNPDPDYITFSGAGEPTLNSRIGEVIDFIKSTRSEVQLAVLTNGTLFVQQQVRQELMSADLVLPSLDAATDPVFAKINRPATTLSAEEHIQGLIEFSNEFDGDIWLEILIIPGINDSEEELRLLKKALLKIMPDRIQLNTLDRPGTEAGLRRAGRQELQQIIDFWELENVEIIAKAPSRKHIRAYREDLENTILETLSRRPCTTEDLAQIFNLHINEVNKYLDVLENEGRISAEREERGVFYRAKEV